MSRGDRVERHEELMRQQRILTGKLHRQNELLEKLVESADGEVKDMSQCEGCGRYFKSVSSHRPHCEFLEG